MPNPFVKLWKYLTASANAQIDERADPKIQIQQAIEGEQQRHQSLATRPRPCWATSASWRCG